MKKLITLLGTAALAFSMATAGTARADGLTSCMFSDYASLDEGRRETGKVALIVSFMDRDGEITVERNGENMDGINVARIPAGQSVIYLEVLNAAPQVYTNITTINVGDGDAVSSVHFLVDGKLEASQYRGICRVDEW